MLDNRPLVASVLLGFSAFTAWVIARDPGGFTIFLRDPWSAQFLGDLTISMLISWSLLAREAKRTGARIWPWVLASIPLGSIAVLVYLLVRPSEDRARAGRIAEPARG